MLPVVLMHDRCEAEHKDDEVVNRSITIADSRIFSSIDTLLPRGEWYRRLFSRVLVCLGTCSIVRKLSITVKSFQKKICNMKGAKKTASFP